MLHWRDLVVASMAGLAGAGLALGSAALGVPAGYAASSSHLLVAILFASTIRSGQRLANLVDRRTHNDSAAFFNLRLVVQSVAAILPCLVLLSTISQMWK